MLATALASAIVGAILVYIRTYHFICRKNFIMIGINKITAFGLSSSVFLEDGMNGDIRKTDGTHTNVELRTTGFSTTPAVIY